jgi:hypothetical protein
VKKNDYRFCPKLISVDEIMNRSSKRGFMRQLSNRKRMTEIWRMTVGTKIFPNTLIKSYNFGQLVVAVKGPAYMERYQYFIHDWKRRMNIEFGDEVITDIVLRVADSLGRTDKETDRDPNCTGGERPENSVNGLELD